MFGLRFKLLICLGSLLLILITVTLLANSVLGSYSDRIQQMFKNDFESALACQYMIEAVENIDLIVSGREWGDRTKEINSIEPMVADFEKWLSVQATKADLEGEKQATEDLRALWKAYKENL